MSREFGPFDIVADVRVPPGVLTAIRRVVKAPPGALHCGGCGANLTTDGFNDDCPLCQKIIRTFTLTIPPMPPTSVLLDIARVCHEQNRGYCATLGDHSQHVWDLAPDWQRNSSIEGVAAIMNGTVKGPGDSHRNWLDGKVRDGWTYGPVKDVEKKQHPCMVPFEELPEDQKLKDVLFFNTASSLLRAHGLLGPALTVPPESRHRPTGSPVQDDIDNWFTYHSPKGDQPARYNRIRQAARGLAMLIAEDVRDSRERSLAFTHLRTAIMFANAGIACNED